MKFGKKLLAQQNESWAQHYIDYKALKVILHGLEGDNTAVFKSEGDFLSAMLASIEAANSFYTGQEAAYDVRLKALAKTLEKPDEWIIASPDLEAQATEPDFPRVVALLEAGVHVSEEKRAALDAFLELCADIDQLRKFSVRAAPLRVAQRRSLRRLHRLPTEEGGIQNARVGPLTPPPSPPRPSCGPLRRCSTRWR